MVKPFQTNFSGAVPSSYPILWGHQLSPHSPHARAFSSPEKLLIRTRPEENSRRSHHFGSDTQPRHASESYAMYPFRDPAEANESIPTETSPASTSSQRKRTNAPSPAEANADGRKVHRVSRACDYCKSKKTRCSGTRPCDSCSRRKIVCEYDTQYMRGRPPTPPIGRESVDRARDATTGREGQLR